MIKAIAFDYGGVLFAEGKSFMLEKMQNYGYDKQKVLEILTSKESLDLRKGLMSDEDFWNWAKSQLPDDYDTEIVKKEWQDGYELDQDILDLVKELKGRYKLIAFSGNVKSRVEYLDRKYDYRKYFDVEVYSYDYHTCKPDLEFVEIMIDKSGVKPEEIAYIDDSEEFSAEAGPLGVNVIIYSRGAIEDLRKELRNLGVEV